MNPLLNRILVFAFKLVIKPRRLETTHFGDEHIQYFVQRALLAQALDMAFESLPAMDVGEAIWQLNSSFLSTQSRQLTAK